MRAPALGVAEYVVNMRAPALGVAEYVVNMRASPPGVAEYVVKALLEASWAHSAAWAWKCPKTAFWKLHGPILRPGPGNAPK